MRLDKELLANKDNVDNGEVKNYMIIGLMTLILHLVKNIL